MLALYSFPNVGSDATDLPWGVGILLVAYAPCHSGVHGIMQVLLVIAIGLRWVEDMRNVKSSQALQSPFSSTSQVLRDGAEKTVSSDSVVVGDVVRLLPGNLVPGDARIMQASTLSIG